MEEKLSSVAKTFSPSLIQELSHLAQRCNAINLAEGFPAPPCIKQAGEMHGLNIGPLTDIAICYGQSEAFAAAIFSIIDKGDEVLLFDPCYATYEGSITIAGGIPVYVSLDPPQWTLDPAKFSSSFTSRTKAIVLNNPHNPTGKVFSREELEVIAECCHRWDCIAITDDGVYEYITFDDQKNETIASLPEMQERTIITLSLSKTFSITEFRSYVYSAWRIGWAIAPASAASAIRNIHVKITDSAPAPFQEAALTALSNQILRNPENRISVEKRFLYEVARFNRFLDSVQAPEFLLFVEYVKELIKQAGVLVVPGCGFFCGSDQPSDENCRYQQRYIRVAFCKSDATLSTAALNFGELMNTGGCPKLYC
ncbi:putative Endo-1,4-beta-glucanase [Hibiscus syriacus]|uniref:Endo-1,4-beta-glucanase n=1 Tax=Hibiscus syriacus TaxID=106335 RepID=A0A6A3CL72_HIBSY|nr:putative Endo-1,4-beta-glucanase [Hibiscus syriacus]